MCGIIGILGQHEVAPLLVEGLKRLEYRGYDSAGIATINDGKLDRRRAVGKLANLSDLLVHDPLAGKSGIGHTRWATHGAATERNAHPHQCGKVTVVHNGIIENFRDLRERLAGAGLSPQTDTDTETVAMLASLHLDRGLSPQDAVRATVAGVWAQVDVLGGDLVQRQFAVRFGQEHDGLDIGHLALVEGPLPAQQRLELARLAVGQH